MKIIRNSITAVILVFLFGVAAGAESVKLNKVTSSPHPRILLWKGEQAEIKQSIADSAFNKNIHDLILKESESIIALSPIERVMIGRRLLGKSREALRRIFFLSYAWRMTDDRRFFERCEREMLEISKFTDWNPSHFLDVAEMTMALSIGYDWLHPELSEKSKKIIREAIVDKGLKPSLDSKNNGWLKSTNNWNQVCNAGMTYGAIAVADEYPVLAKEIIDRAFPSIAVAMTVYKPDGAYPEGYAYWKYGTSFNVMFLSAIEKIFATDFHLGDAPGFMKTAGFIQHMTGANGLPFNWGDCSSKAGFNPAQFWFAQKSGDPSLLWVEKRDMENGDFSRYKNDRLLPASLIWSCGQKTDRITEPNKTFWMGQGANPVCMMRSSWSDPNTVFLGFKAGSPAVNHGHMDVGSFVMESDGVHWASDFGMQDYESLEAKGMSIFGKTQDAQRWSVFRMNNRAHNTLTINGQLQQADGYAKMDRFSDRPDFNYAISNISSVYKGQLASAMRGVAMVGRKFVVVRDEIVAGDQVANVRWNMMTTAVPDLGDGTIKLTKDGKSLVMKIISSVPISLKNVSTAPTNNYDAANPGTTMVGFDLRIEPHQKQTLQVILIPGTVDPKSAKFDQALDDWQ
ncbi:MAG: heparinase II/III family protein [Gloeobacteraceae cyanobacterium ES-bin-144]|nr:heparinase II/III family protein [Verrucomicrobiales bacterium]